MTSRRDFLSTAGAAAAGTLFAHGCRSFNTSTTSAPAVNVNPADAPEVTVARLGFIALTDCAPLVVGKQKGYFDKFGMTDVKVVKQPSWGTVRDNLELGGEDGGIDGAHLLTPIPYLISEGRITSGSRKIPMYILARLNLNGQGISIASTYRELDVRLDSAPFKSKIQEVATSGRDFTCAVTFPGGTHDLWLRYWLAAGGINPDREAATIIIPPPQMVANMEAGNMDAFCAGEPWNAQLISRKLGYSALTTGEIWQNHPEKAFAMRGDWVDKHPKATQALLMAVQEAQMWCDKPENKEEMAQIVSGNQWINTPPENIVARAKGTFDYGDGRTVENSPHRMKFWSDNASYPYKSHDRWFITENMRWGYLPADLDTQKLVDAVNREDLWKAAAKANGQEAAIPASTSRGVETFFDGIKFDPGNPTGYLESLQIKGDGSRARQLQEELITN